MSIMMESALAQHGYASAAQSTASARGVEYQVFARVTHELSNAASAGKEHFPKLAAAIHGNTRLWSIIAADVANNENGLPAELRSKLFYLSEFTHQHSAKVLKQEAKADVLVDINKSVMRGLRSTANDKENE